MGQRNEDRNQEVLQMLKDHTLNEVAEAFGVKRQRVWQIAEMYGVNLKDEDRKVGKGSVYRKIDESGLAGTMPDEEVSRALDVDINMVMKWRKRLGIVAYRYNLPIGCENCKTKPYAKGLCRVCYNRNRRAKS